MSIIDEIVEEYHSKLGACRSTLQICGDSPFTRALAKRCREWGVPYAMVEDTDPGYPVVVDYEVHPGEHAGHSIDDAYTLSACAEGILRLCEREPFGVAWKVVTIVGRGNAVKGLAAALLDADATVCVCHRKTTFTKKLSLVGICDIAVFTSDGIEVHNGRSAYNNSDIGRLTTAILSYRASIWEG